jgi:AmmeMemoRadiSam system protein B
MMSAHRPPEPPRGERPPAVAGRFYPAEPEGLTLLVDGLLDEAPAEEPAGDGLASAYVAPHAGYRYSGRTASYVYRRLRTHAGSVRRVVLIGPAHYRPVRGCAVPTVERWRTPLGTVRVDLEACAALVDAGHATADDEPHAPEHSLEVQLPFLQRALGPDVPVVPMVAGPSTMEAIASAIEAAGGGSAGTVVICSTDLSHYADEPTANAQDERTVGAVLSLDPEAIGQRDACGYYALRGLVHWARSRRSVARLLHRTTSADATNDPSRVVGYAALALT